MSLEIFNRLERLDFLIRTKSTGTPPELAKRLEMSVRNVYHFLDLMRDLGAPIAYCKNRRSYYYAKKCQFSIRFKIKKENPALSVQEEHNESVLI